MFLILLMSGIYPLAFSLSYHFHFVDTGITWPEAQSYCRKTYDDLATIENQDDMQRLVNSIGLAYTGAAWIGLQKPGGWVWHWSLEEQSFFSNVEFYIWAAGEPNNFAGQENCVVMTSLGYWNDWTCNSLSYSVCYDGNDSTNQRYIWITELMTWTDAQSYCRKYYTDLVSINNQYENQLIHTVAQGTPVWIGLFRDFWQWSDQANSTFYSWKLAEVGMMTDNSKCCTSVDSSGKWNSQYCLDSYPFVCYRAITGLKTVVSVKIRTDGDVTDYSDLVLMQLRKELSGRGASENFTLHWQTQADGQIFHLVEEQGLLEEECPGGQ
ncbi:macrophage mannose receptor 1-like isoform X2 [Brienomyrus brachyistius]|nr:macrophage mannose receptor 1-like isoform X2 [Brienomyrus brachyistius]